MNATEWLKRDHDLILEGLDALAAIAKWVQAGGTVPEEDARKLLNFFREFADEYHHHKEEKALFPALEAAGMPPAGPVAVMLREHDEGRRLLKQIGDSLPELSADAALDYVDLLQAHIEKENHVLFHMADRVLSRSDDRSITEMFSQAEDSMPHVLNHDAYRRLFADLRAAASR